MVVAGNTWGNALTCPGSEMWVHVKDEGGGMAGRLHS